jgi:hypothetical protein
MTILLKPEISTLLARPTCTVEQLRGILGLSKNAAYDAVRRGDFKSIRTGGRIHVLTGPLRRQLAIEWAEPETLP